ncbi:MAG TPA: class II aldolase/adducin family protein [Syntrophomonadaceae bacterium]|nr:class II aldolase/adducin family protein [Syntrophomonadaceae bacterium]
MDYQYIKDEVYATAIEIYKSNLVMGTWGNVSQRINQELFVITPSGMDYDSLSPEDMIIVDKRGEVVAGQYQPSIETRMHIEIYKNRLDVNGIVHVHSPYVTAFAVANQPIPVILEETAQVIGHPIEVAKYALCGSQALAYEVAKCLANQENAVLLANHGLVALGSTLSDALRVCFIAEKTAMIAINAARLGKINSLSKKDILQLHEEFKYYGQTKVGE